MPNAGGNNQPQITTPTSIMTNPASPNKRLHPRPKIKLNIPQPSSAQSPFHYPPPSALNIPIPMTAGTNLSGYPPSEENFVFKQFTDFTKFGLGHGERAALWIYDKFSSWSKKWFTHFFLMLVIVLYR